MKGQREHRVPLSEAAIEIINFLKPFQSAADSLVFPGGKKTNPLSDTGLSKPLKAITTYATVHGMRSTFRDWCAETTGVLPEIAEAALAHVNRNRVEAAYLRSDHFEKRRHLMDEWAGYCTSTLYTS
jgi:integrase